jgi:hypothetical protein
MSLEPQQQSTANAEKPKKKKKRTKQQKKKQQKDNRAKNRMNVPNNDSVIEGNFGFQREEESSDDELNSKIRSLKV